VDADSAVKRVKELEVSLSRSFDQSAMSLHTSSIIEQEAHAHRELADKLNESHQHLQEVEAKLVTSQTTERAFSSERESLLQSVRRLESIVSRQKNEIDASKSSLRNSEAEVISLHTKLEELQQQVDAQMVMGDKQNRSLLATEKQDHAAISQLHVELGQQKQETAKAVHRLEKDISKQATFYAGQLEDARLRENDEKLGRQIAEKKYELLLLKVEELQQPNHRYELQKQQPPRTKNGISQTQTLRSGGGHRSKHSSKKSDKATKIPDQTYSPDPATGSNNWDARANYSQPDALFSTRRTAANSMPTVVIEDQVLAKEELRSMLQSATKEVSEARRLGKEPDTAVHDYIHQLEEIISGLSD
jgi:hypothetical protein